MKPQYEPNEKHPHFTIKGTMPTMNEYLTACGRHPQAGAKIKKDYMFLACNAIRLGLKRYKTDKPLITHYIFFEPNMKRDKDNITFMVLKAVHDALQRCGVIPNDGWHNIVNFTHDFYVDKKNPRIEVYLEEIEEKG